MNEFKWYQKLLTVLLVIVFSPLIIAFVIVAGIFTLLEMPKNRKEYKNSRYYKDFEQKFLTSILYSPEYRFYNSAVNRNLPIEYVKQESNGYEYFIFNGTFFLFPDFEQIDYDTEKEEWQADYDGDWTDFDESYKKLLNNLDSIPDIPVKLLVERKMFPLANLNDVVLPECIYLTWNYENAFENEDSPLKMIIPQTSKELYEMMLQTSNLCGKFELANNDEVILWDLYDDIKIKISVDPRDCYFGIDKMFFGKIESSITHWHPTTFEIYDDVCNIGIHGNVLVIRSSWNGSGALYMGNKEDCPYTKDKKYMFRKLYYLEAK